MLHQHRLHLLILSLSSLAVVSLLSLGPSLREIVAFFWPLLLSTALFLSAVAAFAKLSPDLLDRIRNVVRSIVLDISDQRLPSIYLDRYRNHCADPSSLVMGWLRFLEIDRKYDCIRNLNTAYPIPVQVELVEDIVSVAHYILVVEKETVFQRLANDKFCETNHCIVITGRGYPDVSTRRFLRLLTDKLHLPAYCLVDCDPYGLDILMTYRFGTMQMAYDTKFLRVPEIRWIGAFPSDSEKYCLSAQCLLPLKPEDKKKAEAMLLRCYLHREVPRWRLELENMLQRGVKFELEALSASSISFLSEVYIPAKIHSQDYI
ncbi:Meiotic recombination protein SPO11-1 [Acorus gramineus]|uniref:DNA topoisomerase (ATP-hydrolyzing) n=2 Tax=Acorus TaxID=4464 RepID=A0AAV9B8C4_ACOGR|nr:Meiotic recombination protein SPO11-1 [Acorus gramineus]